jgi:hypothetical protein
MKILLGIFTLAPVIALAGVPPEVLNPDVHQDTINQTICQKGYTKSVRPSTVYTNGVKQKLMRKQGIDWSRASELELDHIVPLTLGGHPRNIHNLTLQPWDGPDGAKVKDKLEVRLSHAVCAGKMSLAAAQECIWDDWRRCATEHPKIKTSH